MVPIDSLIVVGEAFQDAKIAFGSYIRPYGQALMKLFLYQSAQFWSVKLKEEDKAKHLFWSFWLTLGALLLWSSPTAFAIVFLLGLVKECWDFKYGSGFCIYDMVCNLIGICAGLFCGFTLSVLLHL